MNQTHRGKCEKSFKIPIHPELKVGEMLKFKSEVVNFWLIEQISDIEEGIDRKASIKTICPIFQKEKKIN